MRDHRNIPSRMSAMDVFGNQDLLKLIFLGNVSPSMHAALRRVCKGFRDLLDSDDEVLASALRYCGGLVKTELRSFLCLDAPMLARLPFRRGLTFYLYEEPAITMLTPKGCAAELAERRRGPVGQRLRQLEARWRGERGDRILPLALKVQNEEYKAVRFGPSKSILKRAPVHRPFGSLVTFRAKPVLPPGVWGLAAVV